MAPKVNVKHNSLVTDAALIAAVLASDRLTRGERQGLTRMAERHLPTGKALSRDQRAWLFEMLRRAGPTTRPAAPPQPERPAWMADRAKLPRRPPTRP